MRLYASITEETKTIHKISFRNSTFQALTLTLMLTLLAAALIVLLHRQ